MEFDKSRILTVVTADQANVGQKGWFASNVETLSRLVLEEQPKELLGFNSNNAVHAFRTSFQNHALFYPAPEPTYAERQAQWLKDNNLKVGSTVKVVSIEHSHTKRNPSGKNSLIGTTNKIIEITDEHICIDWDMLPNKGCWFMSYLDLEPAKPEPVYRPFANAEEFKPYRDEWFVSKCDNSKGSLAKINNYSSLGVVLLREVTKNEDVVFDLCRWDEFFKWFIRENGEPCGVKEEA